MSLKKIILDSGIQETFRFNPTIENWVVARRRAEGQGFEATAVRIGTKRVVIAINGQVVRANRWLTLTAIFVALLLGVLFLASRPQPNKDSSVVSATCLPIAIGDEFLTSDSKASIRDWILSLSSLGTLGSLQQYEVTAKCEQQLWSGQIVVNGIAERLIIKKLTPTKR